MLDIKSEGQPLIAEMKGNQGLSFFCLAAKQAWDYGNKGSGITSCQEHRAGGFTRKIQ